VKLFKYSRPGLILLYSPIIQSISRSLVPTSGAGISLDGPITGLKYCTYFLQIKCRSLTEYERGSTTTPPLLPPKGTPCNALFKVISEASVTVSSSSTDSWNRIPPLYGPKILLCCTRKDGILTTLPFSKATRKYDLYT